MTTPIVSNRISRPRLACLAARTPRLALLVLTLSLLMASIQISAANAEFGFEKEWGGIGSYEGKFRFPTGVAIGPDGSVFVTDTMNNRIQKFDEDGIFQLMWGYHVNALNGVEKFEICLSNCRVGSAGIRQYKSPMGVATDSDGNVYVADTYNDRFHKIRSADEWYWNSGVWYGTGGPGLPPARPSGVAVGSDGNVYGIDTARHLVEMFERDGFEYVLHNRWGGLCDVDDYEDPNECDRRFNRPQGIAVDTAGNVYIADTDNHRIQKFDLGGAVLGKWGSEGTGNGDFKSPSSIAVDSAGNVYVADTGNDRIQVFDSSGVFIKKWGSEGSDRGSFQAPKGVAVDRAGNVYVADTNNNRIQKFGNGEREDEPPPDPPQAPQPTPTPAIPQPSQSTPAANTPTTPEEAYSSACNLKVTSPRLKVGKSGLAKLSVKTARRLFTRGLKGYVRWGTVGGKKVVCKKIKMAILEKRGRRYYIPGTNTMVSKKYLSSKGFPTKGARFFKRKKVGKLTQKRVSKKRQTKISFRQFSRKTKLGRRALKKLRKLKQGSYLLVYTAEVNGKTTKKSVRLQVRKVK